MIHAKGVNMTEKNLNFNILPFNQHIIKSTVSQGDTVIDATVGNGHDTLHLAKTVGKEGLVIGFDIQLQAIESTKNLLNDHHIEHYQLHHRSHDEIDQLSLSNVKLIQYNLGYLPKANKNITTLYQSTYNSIEQGLNILVHKGVILITVYPGHEAGYDEHLYLNTQFKQWPQSKAQVYTYKGLNRSDNAPYTIVIQKV